MQLPEKAFGFSSFFPEFFCRIDDIEPDKKSDTAKDDQKHRIDINNRIGQPRCQAVFPKDIHTGITETGHGIKHRAEQPRSHTILRNENQCIGDCSDRFYQEHTLDDPRDNTGHTIHCIQIITLGDQTAGLHGDPPAYDQKCTGGTGNDAQSSKFDQHQNHTFSKQTPVRRCRHRHKPCHADGCDCCKQRIAPVCCQSGSRRYRQQQKQRAKNDHQSEASGHHTLYPHMFMPWTFPVAFFCHFLSYPLFFPSAGPFSTTRMFSSPYMPFNRSVRPASICTVRLAGSRLTAFSAFRYKTT